MICVRERKVDDNICRIDIGNDIRIWCSCRKRKNGVEWSYNGSNVIVFIREKGLWIKRWDGVWLCRNGDN